MRKQGEVTVVWRQVSGILTKRKILEKGKEKYIKAILFFVKVMNQIKPLESYTASAKSVLDKRRKNPQLVVDVLTKKGRLMLDKMGMELMTVLEQRYPKAHRKLIQKKQEGSELVAGLRGQVVRACGDAQQRRKGEELSAKQKANIAECMANGARFAGVGLLSRAIPLFRFPGGSVVMLALIQQSMLKDTRLGLQFSAFEQIEGKGAQQDRTKRHSKRDRGLVNINERI